MRPLLLHTTSLAQWHALLYEAQQSSAIYLPEDLEAYLVFLLMRFTDQPAIASSILGLDFLNSRQSSSSQRPYLLKEVGDKCLLFAGLFPQRATKKRVKLSYFVKLGQSAYASTAQCLVAQEKLFHCLQVEFPKLMDVLHAMRDSHSAMSLLESLDLWHETGSQLAWKRLCEATQGMPFSPPFKKLIN